MEGIATELSRAGAQMFTSVKLVIKPAWVKPAMVWQRDNQSCRTRTGETRGFACVLPQPFQPPGADPHAGWCGRGRSGNLAAPIPICIVLTLMSYAGRRVDFPPTVPYLFNCQLKSWLDISWGKDRLLSGARGRVFSRYSFHTAQPGLLAHLAGNCGRCFS